MIRYSPTWNPEHSRQMMDRIDRSGQKHPVFVDTLVAVNTVDEVVMAAHGAKVKTQRELLNYMKMARRKR